MHQRLPKSVYVLYQITFLLFRRAPSRLVLDRLIGICKPVHIEHRLLLCLEPQAVLLLYVEFFVLLVPAEVLLEIVKKIV